MAAAMSAGQLPAAVLLWWIVTTSGTDGYGAGYGGALLGLLCVLLFAPLVLPVLGLLHAVLHPLPAVALARRLPGPEWARHLVGAGALGTAWAVPVCLLGDRSFPATAAALSALGVLPVLALTCVRRRARRTGRAWGTWGIWFRSALASAALFVLALTGALAATAAGLIEEYEPPEPTAGQLAGVWRGEDGAVLRLLPGGRAVATGLPARGPYDASSTRDFVVCAGAGTWHLVREGDDARRDEVRVRFGGSCGQETAWTIGGTADAPELFVLFGDPDAGDLRILIHD